MATQSDKPKSAPHGHADRHLPDFLLEPLPVPDVVESDTDTAWGRWEETLQASGHPPHPSDADQPHVDFGDTLPSALAPFSGSKNTKK